MPGSVSSPQTGLCCFTADSGALLQGPQSYTGILSAAGMKESFFMACHSLGHSSSMSQQKQTHTLVQRHRQDLPLDFVTAVLRR